MDFLNIQDGGWLVSLSLDISETKPVIKPILQLLPGFLSISQKENILSYPFNKNSTTIIPPARIKNAFAIPVHWAEHWATVADKYKRNLCVFIGW